MRRISLLLIILAVPALACNLSGSSPAPTPVPPPLLQSPVVGLKPNTGGPGTVVNVGAAGFPAGAKVNLYLYPVNSTAPVPIAEGLSIGEGGLLSFAMQIPAQIGSTTLSGTTPLTFMIATADNTVQASAVFIAVVGNTAGATATSQTAAGGTGDNTGASQLFITGPAIESVQVGGSVLVTGSGAAANNRVGVQVLDANYNILGSALAVINAAPGTVGVWQTTVAFTQPGQQSVGYIVAFTVNAQGGVAEQASIPITLGGSGAPTAGPTTPPQNFPTVPPVTPIFLTSTPLPR